MITNLSISNFKSVRELDIECRKINLFIGEPNTGKSNILEALGLLSWSSCIFGCSLTDYVRFHTTPDIFFDRLLDNVINISINGEPKARVKISFEANEFLFWEESASSPFVKMDYEGNPGGRNYKKTRSIFFASSI
jgi:AAA15 family ATPase/GTPase